MSYLVSIVIPCRNEEKYIEKCLGSVLAFEHPADVTTEILVMDGMSEDRTREIVRAIITKHPRVVLHDNERRIQSTAINKAIALAKGDFIMRLDAHAKYPADYMANCLETALRTKADNVGGIVITLRGGSSFQAGLVQALTTHKFGVGDSSFRTESAIEQDSDTVPFGFFKKEIFDRAGLFDERLLRAQDYEMNRRIIKTGGKIWLNSAIYSEYYNQPTLDKFFSKQFFKEAPYNAYMWYLAPYSFALRHAITGVFSFGIIAGFILSLITPYIAWPFVTILAFYFLLALLSAIQQAKRFKEWVFVLLLPPCFFLFHFIHGLGVLTGLVKLGLGKAPVQKIKEPWPGHGSFRALPANT